MPPFLFARLNKKNCYAYENNDQLPSVWLRIRSCVNQKQIWRRPRQRVEKTHPLSVRMRRRIFKYACPHSHSYIRRTMRTKMRYFTYIWSSTNSTRILIQTYFSHLLFHAGFVDYGNGGYDDLGLDENMDAFENI